MTKKEKQAYRRGIADTLLSIATLGFYSFMAMQVLIKICG